MNLFKNLPFYNITRKAGRSLGILALIFCLALSLFIAAYIGISMKNGLESTEARLGADIIVMPIDGQKKLEGALLGGEPSAFYFKSDISEKINNVEGVDKVSPQVYIASLSASCCSFPVQVIGIDFESDFSVTPWLQGQVDDLESGEVLVGANIFGEKGDQIILYNDYFTIKERLDDTGMGFDNSVFMSIEDARALADSAAEVGVSFPADLNSLVSNIMVDAEDGVRTDILVSDINKAIKGEGRAQDADTIIFSIGDQMSSSANYTMVLLAIVWILCIVVLLITFPMITKSRIGELATLRVLGATKKDISSILLKEIGSLSLFGAIIGVLLGLAISNLFSTAIRNALEVPFLAPSFPAQIIIAIVAILICTIIGPLASLLTINKMNQKEIAIVYSEEA